MDSETPKTVVLGAGPAGLGAAWTFVEEGDQDVVVLELQNRVGGLAGTFQWNEYRLDYGPHKFYTRFGYLIDKMKALLGPDLLTVPKRSGVWLLNRRFEYPLAVKDLFSGLPPTVALRCGISYVEAVIHGLIKPRPEVSYEDYIVNRFGRATYLLVFEPLANKVWGDPRILDAGLARVRVVIPSLFELLWRMMFGDRRQAELSAKQFYYPREGYMQFWLRISEEIEKRGGRVVLESKPTRLTVVDGRIVSVAYMSHEREVQIPVKRIVSTIPIESLLKIITPLPPLEVLDAAAGLRYRAAILLFIVVNRPRISQDAWIFFPEAKYLFNRISEQKAFSAEMIPGDGTVVTLDITCTFGDELWRQSDSEIFERAVRDLEMTGLASRGETKEYFSVRIPRVYPVYDIELRSRMNRIWAHLDWIENLVSVGRHGYFQHNNSDNALDMGIMGARHLMGEESKLKWQEQRKKFDEYQIVD